MKFNIYRCKRHVIVLAGRMYSMNVVGTYNSNDVFAFPVLEQTIVVYHACMVQLIYCFDKAPSMVLS